LASLGMGSIVGIDVRIAMGKTNVREGRAKINYMPPTLLLCLGKSHACQVFHTYTRCQLAIKAKSGDY